MYLFIYYLFIYYLFVYYLFIYYLFIYLLFIYLFVYYLFIYLFVQPLIHSFICKSFDLFKNEKFSADSKKINKIPAGGNVTRSGQGLSWGPIVSKRETEKTKKSARLQQLFTVAKLDLGTLGVNYL
jgi:hypothetical protein